MSYISGLEICRTDIVYEDINPLIQLNQSNASNINVLFSNDIDLQNQIDQLSYNISNIDSNGLVSNLNSLSNLIHEVDLHTSNLDLSFFSLNSTVSQIDTSLSNNVNLTNQIDNATSNNTADIQYLSAYSSNFLTSFSTNVVINKTLDYNSNIFLNFPINEGSEGASNITSILNISNPYKFKASTTTPNQTLLANTWTTIQCSVEEYDTGNSYNTTTYQYTILKSGYYYSDYSVVFLDSSVINNENYQARLLINGTDQSSRALQTSIKANNELVIAKANNEWLNVGDTVELQAWSSVGSTIRSYNGTHFNIHLLSVDTPLEQMKLYTIVNSSNQIQGNIPYWDGKSNLLNSNGYNYLENINDLNTGISNNNNLIGQIDISLSNQILKESADISSLNQGYSNNFNLIGQIDISLSNQILKEANDIISLNTGYSNNSNNISYVSLQTSNFITANQTVALTNKTIDYNQNTLLNLPSLGGGTSNYYYLNDNPIGSIHDYAGSVAPSNFLFCYGQAISRTTYAELFAVIGTTYGTGDGSTTFNLPDYTNRVSAGLGSNFTIGSKLGTSNLFSSNVLSTETIVMTTDSNGYGIINSNFQPTIGMNKIIKFTTTNNSFTQSNIYQVGTNIQNIYNPVWGRIFANTSQCNLTTGVWYDLQLNTFEYQGPCNCFNTSTYTLTAPLTGLYRFSYGVEFQGGSVNDDLFVRLLKNGGDSELSKQQSIIKAGVLQELTLTDILELQEGDTIKMQAKVDSATNTIDVLGNTYENGGYDLTHISFVLEATSSNLNPANQLYLSRDFTLTEQTASNIPAFRGASNELINTNMYVSTSNVGIGTFPYYALDINDTSAIRLPRGTDAQRPSNANGILRYNTTSNAFEGYTTSGWGQIGGGPATDLKSATTTINISSATAPSSNMVLTATSSTNAIWKTPFTNIYICKVHLTTEQSNVVNGAWRDVLMNNKAFDPNNNFNTSTYEYTVPITGYYYINFSLFWINVTANASYWGRVVKNGSTNLLQYHNYTTITGQVIDAANSIVFLTTGETLKLQAYNGSGANIADISVDTYGTWFDIRLISTN